LDNLDDTSSVGKDSKNPKFSYMWGHNRDKTNYKMPENRDISRFKQQKTCFGAKAGLQKKSLVLLFEEINTHSIVYLFYVNRTIAVL
jgi:hypothetical protein